jgi:hypothetical protein
MMTTDDKRRLESIFARFGLSRKSRHKAIGAVKEWLAAAPSEHDATAKLVDAKAGNELAAVLRETRALLPIIFSQLGLAAR